MTQELETPLLKEENEIRQSILEDTRPSMVAAAATNPKEDPPVILRQENEPLEVTLQRYIAEGDVKRFKQLSRAQKPNLCRMHNSEGETLLHSAIKNSQNAILDFVIDSVLSDAYNNRCTVRLGHRG